MLLGTTTAWTFTNTDSPPFVDFKNTFYFGSVGSSMVSLWQMVTLSNWAAISRPIIEKYPHTAIFFIFFVFFTSFGLLSIITGSICSASVKNANENNEADNLLLQEKRTEIINAIGSCFSLADTDGSGSLDHQQVASFISRPQGRAAWRCLGLPLDDVVLILQSFDINRDGKVTREEFVNGILQIMGKSKPKNIVKVMLQVQALGMRANDFTDRLKATKQEAQELAYQITTAFDSIDGELRRKMDPRQYRLGKPMRLRKPAAQTPVSSQSDSHRDLPSSKPLMEDQIAEQPPPESSETYEKHDVEITVHESDRLRDHASRHFLPPGCPVLMKYFKPTPASHFTTGLTSARQAEFRVAVRAAPSIL
eukprot:GEMP01018087.1.p1 GENE.GEMP01018087.1~~GEMP01018087.1.p1  ORF type:complete len:365 (+),score=51.12 GEMP01018087.1:814-1908(+)